MHIDDQTQNRREKTPNREECFWIEQMGYKKSQEHGGTENADFQGT